MREKGFNRSEQLTIFKKIHTVPTATKRYNNNSTFVSLNYTFSLVENKNVYTENQGTNREKYFNHFISKGKIPTPAEKKHLCVHFVLHGPRLFHLSTKKLLVQSVRNGHQSGQSRAEAKKLTKTRDQTGFP